MSAKRSLGRGLDALLPKSEKPAGVEQLPIAALKVSSFQPRRHFDAETIAELSASIADKGVLQPLLVRPQGDAYEIVAGERRFRAAQEAGLTQVPVVIKELDDRQTLEIAVIENVQRENLTAVEEARAYAQLQDFGMNQEAVAKAVGKSRSAVANTLRLLQLDNAALASLEAGEITAGHARALLAIPESDRAWALSTILERQLSVRQTEELKRPAARQAAGQGASDERAQLKALELNLSRVVGTKVKVSGRDKGKLELYYGSEEELERLLELLHYQA